MVSPGCGLGNPQKTESKMAKRSTTKAEEEDIGEDDGSIDSKFYNLYSEGYILEYELPISIIETARRLC